MKRPTNVIIVMTDDQGYGDLGCTGNPWIKTPHIDAFSREAVRCNDFHVAPLCTPTRGAIMTGRYPLRNGAWATAWGRSILKRDETTMADVFLHNDYETGLFGKWHLGDNYPYRPQDRGFKKVVAHKGGGVGQTPDHWGNSYFDDTYFNNGTPQEYEGYCTDIWFDEAKSFIDKCEDKPFFAFIATNAPHTPYFVDGKYAEQYRNNPDILEPEFYGMITNIDENFGKLDTFLQQRGLRDNTLVIFMTDNGTSGGTRLDKNQFPEAGYNAGMRGMKGSYYEGGHRVPFFLRCPDLGLADSDHNNVFCHIDMLPTFIDLFDLEVPHKLEFDGLSQADALSKEGVKPENFSELSERSVVLQNCQSHDLPDKWENVVLHQSWRLVHGAELYDVEIDSGQRNDVADQHPDIVEKLRAVQNELWKEVVPNLSDFCPHHIGNENENPTRLNSMDVMGDIAWDQPHVLEALMTSGRWTIEVDVAGLYRIALRRWPEELDIPITSVPEEEFIALNKRHGSSGRHFAISAKQASLSVADQKQYKDISTNAKEVVFELELDIGKSVLEANFIGENGNEQGAYYVYVTRLTNTAE